MEEEMGADAHVVALGEAPPLVQLFQWLQVYQILIVPKPRFHKSAMKSSVRFERPFLIHPIDGVFPVLVVLSKKRG